VRDDAYYPDHRLHASGAGGYGSAHGCGAWSP
jgi:hypothetical protein